MKVNSELWLLNNFLKDGAFFSKQKHKILIVSVLRSQYGQVGLEGSKSVTYSFLDNIVKILDTEDVQ